MMKIQVKTARDETRSEEERIQARLAMEHTADCYGYERRGINMDFLLLEGLEQAYRGIRLSMNWNNTTGRLNYLHLLDTRYEDLKLFSGRRIGRKKTEEQDSRMIEARSDDLRRLIPLIIEREARAREANQRVVMDRNLDRVVGGTRYFRMEPDVPRLLSELYRSF